MSIICEKNACIANKDDIKSYEKNYSQHPCSGLSSNRWINPSILIGCGYLYPILHGPVVVSVAAPNSSFELNSKHNLEQSGTKI